MRHNTTLVRRSLRCTSSIECGLRSCRRYTSTAQRIRRSRLRSCLNCVLRSMEEGVSKKKPLTMEEVEAAEQVEQEARAKLHVAMNDRFPYVPDEVSVDNGGASVMMHTCGTCGAWVPAMTMMEHHQWHERIGE